MNRRFFTIARIGACAVGLIVGSVGCAGSSPQFSTPQMTAELPKKDISARAGGGGNSPAKSQPTDPDANLPPVEAVKTPKGVFLEEPYIQLGATAADSSLALRWSTAMSDKKDAAPQPAAWSVETRPAGGTGAWQRIKESVTARKIAPPGIAGEFLYETDLTGLTPGALVDYRVLDGGKPVFSGRARAPKGASQPVRFVVFGDSGAGTPAQKKVAYQVSKARPDLVFITGDIVYDRGRAEEYRTRFFPVYNADVADPKEGAPLLRSTLFAGSVGNHDADYAMLDKYPDGLAYFYYWDQPRNGPVLTAKKANTPPVRGSETAEKALLEAAGDAYPRTTNYSFDYGNTHWLVLDSNYYVDWSDPALRAWVEKDLTTTKAVWKFVAFHIPPFHSSKKHQDDQYMRVLCDLFEKCGVDIVWSGHVHNYQRTRPMKFATAKGPTGAWRDDKGRVAGKWTLDTVWDGEKNTKTNSPVYIVDGAGGAPLYDVELEKQPNAWQEFTTKYIGGYSFSVVETDAKKLTLRQLDDNGKEVDHFTLTK